MGGRIEFIIKQSKKEVGFVFGIVIGLRSLNGTSAVLYSLALALEILGLRSIALGMFKSAIKKSPHNRWLHLHASRLCLKKGQVDMAVTHWKKAAGPEDIGCFIYWLKKSNRIPALYGKTGRNLCSLAPEDEAGIITPARKKIPESEPQDPGLEMLERGNIDGALEFFFKELQTEKSDPGLLFNTGVALSKLNKHEEALVYYEKAQEVGLNNLELLNNKGYSLFNLARYDEAQTCYELARGMASNDYIIFNNLAACYAKTGQAAKAHQSFIAAVEQNPGDPLLINNLSMCLEICGKAAEALKYYDRALVIGKDQNIKNTVLINKVNCLIRLKRYQEALESCDQMFRDGSGSEFELWTLRAELLNKLGRAGEAADSYRKALGLAV